MKLKKNDEVVIISGSEKGKTGFITKIDKKNNRVFVKDINKVVRHRKPSQQNTEGSIETKEASIHISNVALKSKESKKGSPVASKIGYKFEKAKKIRIDKKTGKEIYSMKSSLEIKYDQEIVPALIKKFNYTSIMQVPKVEKIIINMTAGKEVSNSKAIEEVINELTLITGQKPLTVIAKKSNASFKLREGMAMGGKVTMRRERMWTFLYELINISIPRIRDFRGVNPKAFDGRGNYALGVKEQIIFPEISFDKIRRIKGLDVIIVTTAKTDEEAFELLKLLGMPFAKVQQK